MALISAHEIDELSQICPGAIATDVDLSKISKWRTGGLADLIVRPSTTEQVQLLCQWFAARDVRPIVFGLTTNLLFDDKGLKVPCIQIGSLMAKTNVTANTVVAQAGTWVPSLARIVMKEGLTDLEHTCGIPGTLGGLICMNGGSQRKSIASNVVEVESVNLQGEILKRKQEDCKFSYRHSIYQECNEIITTVELKLSEGNRQTIRANMNKILNERRKKFPRKEPNCGSVFKSNPAMYEDIGAPGLAIERAGLKGISVGSAIVSHQHANFILNKGGAQSKDILDLISIVSDAVFSATGYRMETEVSFIHSDGKRQSAYNATTTQ